MRAWHHRVDTNFLASTLPILRLSIHTSFGLFKAMRCTVDEVQGIVGKNIRAYHMFHTSLASPCTSAVAV